MVPEENAMNLIHGLQRNQTKVWYEELAYIYIYIYMLINTILNLQAVFFGHVMRKKKLKHLVTTGLILKEKAAGKRSERRCSMD